MVAGKSALFCSSVHPPPLVTLLGVQTPLAMPNARGLIVQPPSSKGLRRARGDGAGIASSGDGVVVDPRGLE